jgi:uncharacterized protein YigA (DUF484 family)
MPPNIRKQDRALRLENKVLRKSNQELTDQLLRLRNEMMATLEMAFSQLEQVRQRNNQLELEVAAHQENGSNNL